jgi:hypothetical protein
MNISNAKQRRKQVAPIIVLLIMLVIIRTFQIYSPSGSVD